MPRVCHPFHTTLTAHTHNHTHTAKYICAKKWKKPCLGEKFATCFCARCEKCVSSSQLITGSRTQNSTRAQTFPHTYIIFVRGFVWPTIWGTLTCTLCTHTHIHTGFEFLWPKAKMYAFDLCAELVTQRTANAIWPYR